MPERSWRCGRAWHICPAPVIRGESANPARLRARQIRPVGADFKAAPGAATTE